MSNETRDHGDKGLKSKSDSVTENEIVEKIDEEIMLGDS